LIFLRNRKSDSWNRNFIFTFHCIFRKKIDNAKNIFLKRPNIKLLFFNPFFKKHLKYCGYKYECTHLQPTLENIFPVLFHQKTIHFFEDYDKNYQNAEYIYYGKIYQTMYWNVFRVHMIFFLSEKNLFYVENKIVELTCFCEFDMFCGMC